MLTVPPGCGNLTKTNPSVESNRHAAVAAINAAGDEASIRAVPLRRTVAGRAAWMRSTTGRGLGDAIVTVVGPAPSVQFTSAPSKTEKRETPFG